MPSGALLKQRVSFANDDKTALTVRTSIEGVLAETFRFPRFDQRGA